MGISETAMAEERIRMMTRGRGVELDPKPFFKMDTALTSSPRAMAFALAGKPRDA